MSSLPACADDCDMLDDGPVIVDSLPFVPGYRPTHEQREEADRLLAGFRAAFPGCEVRFVAPAGEEPPARPLSDIPPPTGAYACLGGCGTVDSSDGTCPLCGDVARLMGI